MRMSSRPGLALGGGGAEPDEVQFLIFSNEEMRRLSVAQITTPQSFDAMGNPNKGGLYDSALGPTRDRNDLCATCSNSMLSCPGHFGHIELPLVTVNPLFFKQIYTIFRMSCLKCHRLQVDDRMKGIISLQLKLLDAGHITEALDLESFLGEVAQSKEDGDISSIKTRKIVKKYTKLLNKIDPVADTFNGKNTTVLRTKFINNIYKNVNPSKSCKFCREKLIKITTSDNKLMYNAAQDGGKGIKILMADEIRNHCYKIAENDEETLCLFIPVLQHVGVKPVSEIFFLQVVPVPPSNIRPCNVLRGELVEHPQTLIYKSIIQAAFAASACLKVYASENKDKALGALESVARQAYESVQGSDPATKLHTSWQELQKTINQILDCEVQGQGIKQVIEKKTGIIRMHMMGKRVNFAARSVITPDPNVDIDEIGIPDAFATKLTYPVPVTEWNIYELRKMVINGPNKHPGAEKIVNEDGRVIRIPTDSIEKRKALAKRLLTPDEYKTAGLKIVHRHLVNGDVLILNRQPSLHKPSMMAHRARILKGEKTLRLHYANCKSYNADFDGDEMNAHFPQNEIARSEAYNLMSVTKQYLVPKDGTPLSGLIQDHVISGVKMSLRGTFFDKSDYHQIVFQGLSRRTGKIKLLPPAIIKPRTLWSGKQILSTIIMNIIPKGKPYLSLNGKAKISSKAWQKEPPRKWKAGGTAFKDVNTMTEAEVIIRKGELLCGVLDKTHYGATPYGLVHCMYELYGGGSSSALLSAFSKVFTLYLQWEGFTLGVKDILVVEDANSKRDDYICIVRSIGNTAAAQATDMPVDTSDEKLRGTIEELMTKDPKFRSNLDRQYKSVLDKHTNNINTACLSEGLLEIFPYNNLQLMVQSGAKGSTVNTMQISCLLGQIELEGKRPPLMISGRSLPSFPPYDTTPRAGGFIDGRFMTGIQPQEFFFHCMAGREGLIDTAVKTSRSGYLQRCLIKHLEGLSVGYDMTVRDSDGSVIQFAYGEDGLDVLKCQFLNEEQFEFLDQNSDAVTSKSTIKKLREGVDLKEIRKAQKSLNRWRKKFGDPLHKTRTSPFVEFTKLNKNNVTLVDTPSDQSRDAFYPSLESMWRSIDPETQKSYSRKQCPEPIACKTSPEFKFGVLTERLDNLMQRYLKSRSLNRSHGCTDSERFVEVMSAKNLISLADPGEPVGLLAAQSIGEPSTQMTLNTFHFAGRGDMNVTLGIPRLREILMTASVNLKTPNMDIPFLEIPDINKKSERLRQLLNRVTVADILEKIEVQCELITNPDRKLKTTLRFCFLPQAQYKTQYIIKPKQIIKHMQKKFFAEMFGTIKKMARATCGVVWSQEKDGSRRRRGAREGDDTTEGEEVESGDTEKRSNKARENLLRDDDSSDDEQPDEDDDNTAVKNRNKRAEEQEYEDPESEEEEKSEDEEEAEKDVEEVIVDTNTPADAADADKIASEVIDAYKDATNYSFDTKLYRWCELTVLFPVSFLRIDLSQALRDTTRRSVVHEVKNIRRAITYKNKSGLYLKTEGINIVQMFTFYEILDMNKLYSNDIHAIANTYGIEAASKVIIKEIQSVFNVYGIQVDPRHLSLISDYMTFNGVYEPMSRRGMESSTSPLQQMSFESSLVFLKQAILNGKKDSLRSASSCLMLGQPCRSGTGAFTLYKTAELR